MSDQRSALARRELLTTAALASATVSLQGAPTRSKLASISALALAPDGKLIAADWKAGKLHALQLPAAPATQTSASFNLRGVDARLAAALQLPVAQIRLTAAVFDQAHARAVIACDTANRGSWLALVSVDGKVTTLDPSRVIASSLSLDDAPADAALWDKIPTRSFLVTCMECRQNEVLVAGLANADFSSTLRRIPYPFAGSATATAVEMYHTIHNQIETRAPIRAFTTLDLAGEPYILAAYTCTPLVLLPMSELRSGKARGKTIAELGYGNTPVSVVPFQIEYQGQTSRWVVVANSSKSADLISVDAIAAAAQKPGLAEPVRVPFVTRAGVPAIDAPLSGMVALVDQDPQFLLGLRRDLQSGSLDLLSFRKGAFFRLSDHVNEYDFPTYDYPVSDAFQQQYVRPFHKLMRTDEGFSKLVK